MFKFLSECLEGYCKALADPHNNSEDYVLLTMIVVFAIFLVFLLVSLVIATNGTLLIVGIVIYGIIRALQAYGVILLNEEDDD